MWLKKPTRLELSGRVVSSISGSLEMIQGQNLPHKFIIIIVVVILSLAALGTEPWTHTPSYLSALFVL